jgi:hypothetical protein
VSDLYNLRSDTAEQRSGDSTLTTIQKQSTAELKLLLNNVGNLYEVLPRRELLNPHTLPVNRGLSPLVMSPLVNRGQQGPVPNGTVVIDCMRSLAIDVDRDF